MKGPEDVNLDLAAAPGLDLGPGVVEDVAGERVRVRTERGSGWASWAVGYPYSVQPGDTVLCIADGRRRYVIGVLKGSGETTLSVPGDLKLRAPHGHVDIESGRGVRVRAPRVGFVTPLLELTAKLLEERFENVDRWIEGRLDEQIGSVRSRIEKTYSMLAGRIRQRAKGRVKIDGERIDLG
ncbi:MAG: DUF3540 domain-containing protein [Myxococcota bacterium]